MPKLDGFEVLELVGRDVAVVFVTAYDQYALRAFEVHAVDYLLKPFSAERLAAALERARERLGRGERLPVQELAGDGAAARRATPAACWSATARACTSCRSRRSTTCRRRTTTSRFRCDGKEYLKEQTLAQVEAALDPAKFVRIHRSYRAEPRSAGAGRARRAREPPRRSCPTAAGCRSAAPATRASARGCNQRGWLGSSGSFAASHAARPPAISLTCVKPRRCRRLAAIDER